MNGEQLRHEKQKRRNDVGQRRLREFLGEHREVEVEIWAVVEGLIRHPIRATIALVAKEEQGEQREVLRQRDVQIVASGEGLALSEVKAEDNAENVVA
jgi:hypothetical protein